MPHQSAQRTVKRTEVRERIEEWGSRSLGRLASEMLRVHDWAGSTPVILVPRQFVLRPPFFAALAGALLARTSRRIRFDWCRPDTDLLSRLGDLSVRLQVARLNRLLLRIAEPRCTADTDPRQRPLARVEISATIGRPGGSRRDLVIGVCAEGRELPPWTTPIYLFGGVDLPQAG